MITFFLTIASALGVMPIPWYILGVAGLVDGVIFLPLFTMAFVQFGPAGLRTAMGRLHFLQGTATADGTVTVLDHDGYHHCAFDEERNVVYYDGVEGGEFDYDPEKSTWYRLGKRKYGVTYVPNERLLKPWLDEDAELLEVDDSRDVGILDRMRGGEWMVTHYPERLRSGGEGYLVSMSKAMSALHGGAGTKVADRTEQHTLKDEGGPGGFSDKQRAIVVTVVILSAAITGVLITGVLG